MATSACTQCGVAYAPMPFPLQDDEDGGAYTDSELERRFANLFFLPQMQGMKCDDGLHLLEQWEVMQKKKWEKLCRECWLQSVDDPLATWKVLSSKS